MEQEKKRELFLSFCLSAGTSVFIIINLFASLSGNIVTTRSEQGNWIYHLIYYSLTPITYPVSLLVSKIGVPIFIEPFLYPVAFIVIWTGIFSLSVQFTKKIFTSIKYLKYLPSILISLVFALTLFLLSFPTFFSSDSFLESCVGLKAKPTEFGSDALLAQNGVSGNVSKNTPISFEIPDDLDAARIYYGFSCLGDYMNDKFLTGLSSLNREESEKIIDKALTYCRSLPEIPVNPKILSDQAYVPNLMYKDACLEVIATRLSILDEKFILGLDNFSEQFPQWQELQTKAGMKIFNEERQKRLLFQEDVRNYVCKRFYGPQKPGIIDSYSTCIRPRINIWYQYRSMFQ